jgi:hypothetical protein
MNGAQGSPQMTAFTNEQNAYNAMMGQGHYGGMIDAAYSLPFLGSYLGSPGDLTGSPQGWQQPAMPATPASTTAAINPLLQSPSQWAQSAAAPANGSSSAWSGGGSWGQG